MKKLCILLALIMIPASMWALSIENDASFGLFGNEMDAASSVGEEFLDLDKTYIFGGVSDLNSGGPDYPILLGAYIHDDDMPWSVFTDLNYALASFPHDKVDVSNSTKTTTDTTGTVTKNYEWVDQNTVTKYDNKLFNSFNDNSRFITVYDGMVVGAFLNINRVNNSIMGIGSNNYKKTDSIYINRSSTSEPLPELDYTIEEKESDKNIITEALIQVPVLISNEGSDQTISAKVGLGIYNFSNTHSKEFSDREWTPASETNILQDDTIDKTTKFTVGGSYGQSINSPFLEDADKSFTFGGAVDLVLWGKKFEKTLIEQYRDYAAGSVATDKARNEDSEKLTAGSMDITARANASHEFAYDLGDNVKVKMKPAVSLNIARSKFDPLSGFAVAEIKDYTYTDKEDNNNDKDFEDSVDRIETITITSNDGFVIPVDFDLGNDFSHDPLNPTAGVFVRAENTANSVQTEVRMNFSPAVAMQFKPEKWGVGFTLGSKADLSVTRTVNTIKKREAVIKTITKDGDGTTISESTDEFISVEGDNEKTVEMDWNATINNQLSMDVDVSDNVQLLFQLNNSLTGLAINNLTVQALVSLP